MFAMRVSILRRTAIFALLTGLAAACSEGPTDPGPDPGSTAFSLLIERRNAAGQRSFYTLAASDNTVAPFTGVPADARTLIPSPDGKTIAYLREVDGFVRLWAMDRDGANRRPILNNDIYVETAAWSPGGTKFVVAYSTGAVSNDIATLNADGTGFVNLTPDPLPGVYSDSDPSWSPDGTRIAFSSNRSGTRRLWLMNANGSAPSQVIPAAGGGTERGPVWSPDGAFIAVIGVTSAGPGITFIRPDGTGAKHVVTAAVPNDPLWLPDGRLIYAANPTGDYDLYSIDRSTGLTTRITSRRDHDVHAAVLVNVAPFAWLGFAAPVTHAINRPLAVDIAAGDVITDGFNDLLVLTPLLNEMKLMRGSANGTLQQIGSLFGDENLVALTTAMITPDLAPDIIARDDSALYLWRGRSDGPGTATRIPLDGIVRASIVLDADASGRADIVSLVENVSTQPFRVTTHTVGADESIVFAVNMITTRLNGRSMCAGDANNDGRGDVVLLAGSTALSPFIVEGHGELGFFQPEPAGSSFSTDLNATPLCADFNGDGRDDVALLTVGQTLGVSIHLKGATTFSLGSRIAPRASSMALADIDRDGDVDILLGSSATAEIFIVKNRGDGRFEQSVALPVTNAPTRIVANDFNNDHWPDVAFVDAVGQLVILLSRGRTGM